MYVDGKISKWYDIQEIDLKFDSFDIPFVGSLLCMFKHNIAFACTEETGFIYVY